MVTVLLTGRQRFEVEENNTFKKFMSLRFKCGAPAISEEEAMRFYMKVQKELVARLDEIRH